MPLFKRALAECFGTFWLVLMGCGAAVLTAGFPGLGIGFLGVAFAFGLAQLTMCYAVGPISGAHINPAVSVGLWLGGRLKTRDLPVYLAAQVVGAIVAAFVLLLLASGKAGFSLAEGFAQNGYGLHSPGGYSVGAAFLAEVIFTFVFVVVILASTNSERLAAGFAPIAIGLTLMLIHLVDIPITNASVNPARSTGPALLAGGWAVHQLWLFWVAPLLGGAIAGLAYVAVGQRKERERIAGAPVARPT